MSVRSGATEDPDLRRQLIPAAQYVRMSSDYQQYSTRNQADSIAVYAACHGFRIVRTYADEGRSGLTLKRRASLRQLLEDVTSGQADFRAILVYDVSRWGRFQDVDESAHYEFLCRRAGIAIHYCAEQFDNEGGMTAMILKHLKRIMAAEYSRELSTKVYVGQNRLAALGYRQGGKAGYGLRRMVIDDAGNPRFLLEPGEYKNMRTDRVILVPGPAHEVETVRRIYRMYVRGRMCPRAIMDQLNAEGIPAGSGKIWTGPLIRELLTNEKYVGNNVCNRTTSKLASKQVFNPPDGWIRVKGAFEAIVTPRQFAAAQRAIRERGRDVSMSETELLTALRELWRRCGGLSIGLIERAPWVPSAKTYRRHFGSIAQAYEQLGYVRPSGFAQIRTNSARRREHPKIIAGILAAFRRQGAKARIDPESELLIINERLRVSLVFARHGHSKTNKTKWMLRFEASLNPDFTLVLCLAADERRVAWYLLLPKQVFNRPGPVRLTQRMMAGFGDYCSSDLRMLLPMIEVDPEAARAPARCRE